MDPTNQRDVIKLWPVRGQNYGAHVDPAIKNHRPMEFKYTR
jgi:hypothetical protein